MGDGVLTKSERFWINTFSLNIQKALELAETTAASQKLHGTATAFGKANPLLSGLTSLLTTYFEEFEATGNVQRSTIKAVLTGTTALTIGVLAGTLGAPASLVFVGGAVATYIGTKVIGQIFDVVDDAFGLFYDSKLNFSGSANRILYSATKNADKVTGSAFDDHIFGMGANDRLIGGQGNDKLFGGAGSDRLSGGGNDDELYGGGGNARDILKGGAGSDFLDGGGGGDDMRGGAGSDEIVFRDLEDKIYGGSGEDWAISEVAEIDLTDRRFHSIENIGLGDTGKGPSLAQDAYGDNKNNKIIGNGNDNKIDGRGGNDSIWGQQGKDTINGGKGTDTIFGGKGKDTITIEHKAQDIVDAGAGDDTIIIKKGYDHIVDGGAGWDILDVRGLDLAKLTPSFFLNFKNIEEVWTDTDDILLFPFSSVISDVEKVKLFGNHVVDIQTDSPEIRPLIVILGALDIELAKNADLKLSFTSQPGVGFSTSDYNTTNFERYYYGTKAGPIVIESETLTETVQEYELGKFSKTGNSFEFQYDKYFQATRSPSFGVEGFKNTKLSGNIAILLEEFLGSDKGFDFNFLEFTYRATSFASSTLGGPLGVLNDSRFPSNVFDFPALPGSTVETFLIGYSDNGVQPVLTVGDNTLTWELLFA